MDQLSANSQPTRSMSPSYMQLWVPDPSHEHQGLTAITDQSMSIKDMAAPQRFECFIASQSHPRIRHKYLSTQWLQTESRLFLEAPCLWPARLTRSPSG